MNLQSGRPPLGQRLSTLWRYAETLFSRFSILELFRQTVKSGLKSIQGNGVSVRRDIVGEINSEPIDRADGRVWDGDRGLIATTITISPEIFNFCVHPVGVGGGEVGVAIAGVRRPAPTLLNCLGVVDVSNVCAGTCALRAIASQGRTENGNRIHAGLRVNATGEYLQGGKAGWHALQSL